MDGLEIVISNWFNAPRRAHLGQGTPQTFPRLVQHTADVFYARQTGTCSECVGHVENDAGTKAKVQESRNRLEDVLSGNNEINSSYELLLKIMQCMCRQE